MSVDALHLPPFHAWQTTDSYERTDINFTPAKFFEVSNLLLENPNFNSTHLFRADILYDSTGSLKTAVEREEACCGTQSSTRAVTNGTSVTSDYESTKQPRLDDRDPTRVVIRRLIPRNPSVDQLLDQTCLHYELDDTSHAVVYIPDVEDEAAVPWYHPPVKALAYIYEGSPVSENSFSARLSVCFLPFNEPLDPIPERLHRTLISLLCTFIRLSNHPTPQIPFHTPSSHPSTRSTAPSAIKDTIIPQHLVQNTYTTLKARYASSLISRWVESTEPSKHVFEDLSIAAFLIELWKVMYSSRGIVFPRFVDIACGNGVLVYILISEGYQGYGFDARRRKTWDILDIDEFLEEKICVPEPFLDALELSAEDALPYATVHDGVFAKGTFIISNHADELTSWTPILAALSCPESPLPFLAIPCCSHALSGAKKRYTPKDVDAHHLSTPPASTASSCNSSVSSADAEEQPLQGDLKSLRAAKQKAANHKDDKSMYACLTKKVVALAEEIGIEVEMTLMRIPSTRNIGIVGGRSRLTARDEHSEEAATNGHGNREANVGGVNGPSLYATADLGAGSGDSGSVLEKVQSLIERECASTGGIQASARTWIERAMVLQKGKGRGKVNLGHKPETHEEKMVAS